MLKTSPAFFLPHSKSLIGWWLFQLWSHWPTVRKGGVKRESLSWSGLTPPDNTELKLYLLLLHSLAEYFIHITHFPGQVVVRRWDGKLADCRYPGWCWKEFLKHLWKHLKADFDWAQIKCRFFVRQIVTGLQTKLTTRAHQNAVRNRWWAGEFYCANAEHFVEKAENPSRRDASHRSSKQVSFDAWQMRLCLPKKYFDKHLTACQTGFFFLFWGKLKINLFQLRRARRERPLRLAWQLAPCLVSTISFTGGGADIWKCVEVGWSVWNAVLGCLNTFIHQHVSTLYINSNGFSFKLDPIERPVHFSGIWLPHRIFLQEEEEKECLISCTEEKLLLLQVVLMHRCVKDKCTWKGCMRCCWQAVSACWSLIPCSRAPQQCTKNVPGFLLPPVHISMIGPQSEPEEDTLCPLLATSIIDADKIRKRANLSVHTSHSIAKPDRSLRIYRRKFQQTSICTP